MTRATTEKFRRALRHFRTCGVDAVVITGDLGDWGLRSNFAEVRWAWDQEMNGSGIVPLFITGNHDWEGFRYADMAVEMHALGFGEEDAAVRHGMRESWEAAFGEPFAPVRCRTVKGFDFVSCEYGQEGKLAEWMAANGGKYRGDRPFFYLQHFPLSKTPKSKSVLNDFPNCVAMTGHVHTPFHDERTLLQDPMVMLSVPSLSFATIPEGFENGKASRNGDCRYAMQMIPDRFNLRGGDAGYVVSVYSDELVVEKRDFHEDCEGAAPWVVPLPAGRTRKFAPEALAARLGVPAFPADAGLVVDTRNATNRQGRWIAAMRVSFPSAAISDGTRVHDYEIRAVPRDGSKPMVKRFLSPAYSRIARREPKRQCFWFDVLDLPQGRSYVLEVRARNCFGKCSEPLVSAEMCGRAKNNKAGD